MANSHEKALKGKEQSKRERANLSEYNTRHGKKASMGEFKGGIKKTASALGIKKPRFD